MEVETAGVGLDRPTDIVHHARQRLTLSRAEFDYDRTNASVRGHERARPEWIHECLSNQPGVRDAAAVDNKQPRFQAGFGARKQEPASRWARHASHEARLLKLMSHVACHLKGGRVKHTITNHGGGAFPGDYDRVATAECLQELIELLDRRMIGT